MEAVLKYVVGGDGVVYVEAESLINCLEESAERVDSSVSVGDFLRSASDAVRDSIEEAMA